ncbi:MAG: amylo-alpha-1,6-glucosidase [Gammaproteobacteria bacterium]
MKDVIQHQNQWYVLATSSRADDRTRTLKHGETFGLFDRFGDLQHAGTGDQGLYHEGTRFLSHFELLMAARRPMLLHSAVKEDNSLLMVDLTNPDLEDGGSFSLAKGTIHIFRAKALRNGVHYEHVHVTHYGEAAVSVALEFRFAADYADIFEVRGVRRARRGEMRPAQVLTQEVVLGYRGLDGVDRRTRVGFSQVPQMIAEDRCCFELHLAPRESADLYVTVACEGGVNPALITDYGQAFAASCATVRTAQERSCAVFTSNEQFNDWINRSAADLQMLISETPHGPYPYAGVPWFSTPFGRDGIITALQYLWVVPELAKGVLTFLAATQGTEVIHEQDAEPGKILHETRLGEMAALGEVPFRQYYGSVDATPLFVVLAGAYYDRTGDSALVRRIWPNIQRALEWIDKYGDRDGDGFVEYARTSSDGLVQQGWKDSNDSVFHQDGRLAQGPIALCEVQGYVYEAKLIAARLARLFGESERADAWQRQAEQLKGCFDEAFWCEDMGTYALALDGEKRPCRVRSSNAGHTLFSGIAAAEHAPQVVAALFHLDSFSGWGIRTLAKNEARFNPMSYHNGSIWPHDNALIAMGLARYGFKLKTIQILTGLFNTSIMMDLHRLPELFCGFDRLGRQGPTLYPVACSPQAWASATVFYVLQACLGLSFSPESPQVRFQYPQLPDYLDGIRMNNLQVGDAVLDLVLRRHRFDVGINVSRKTGDIDISVHI